MLKLHIIILVEFAFSFIFTAQFLASLRLSPFSFYLGSTTLCVGQEVTSYSCGRYSAAVFFFPKFISATLGIVSKSILQSKKLR